MGWRGDGWLSGGDHDRGCYSDGFADSGGCCHGSKVWLDRHLHLDRRSIQKNVTYRVTVVGVPVPAPVPVPIVLPPPPEPPPEPGTLPGAATSLAAALEG